MENQAILFDALYLVVSNSRVKSRQHVWQTTLVLESTGGERGHNANPLTFGVCRRGQSFPPSSTTQGTVGPVLGHLPPSYGVAGWHRAGSRQSELNDGGKVPGQVPSMSKYLRARYHRVISVP